MRPHFFQNRQAVVLIVISALALSGGVSSQQDKRASTGTPAFSLTIQAKDHTIKTGSPVWVDVTERNNSDQILPLGRGKPLTADQGGETFTVDVWNEKGMRPDETTFYRRKLGHLTLEERAEAPVPLGGGEVRFVKPGETTTDRIDVGRLYDLSRPGRYTIQVQLPIQSNKITVTVSP
jgi:hypothetical protein